MDQIKIGKFIAATRAAKKLTQDELAEKIGVTDKAISKWENGRCLPDVSLFKPLCKTLGISVNELLNGEKDTNEDGYINYIKETNKNNKLKLILTILVSTTILILLLLGIYFLNNYGKTTVYKLYGESENFTYTDGLLIVSNEKYVLVPGEIITTNSSIQKESIKEIIIKSNDNTIVGGTKLSLTVEDVGYNEMFSKEKIDNLDNWYLVIFYQLGAETKEEIIEFKTEKILKNNKFITTTAGPIGEKQETPEKTNSEKYLEKLDKIAERIENAGYSNNGHGEGYPIFCKNINNKEKICINILTEALTYNLRIDQNNYINLEKRIYLPQKNTNNFNIYVNGRIDGKEINQKYNEKTGKIEILYSGELEYKDIESKLNTLNKYYPSAQKIFDVR